VLPSEPVTVTPVALVALTVRVDEAPGAIEVGLAVIVTVAVPALTVPQPVTSRSNDNVIAIGNRIKRRTRGTRTCTMGLSFLFSGERAMAQPANSKIEGIQGGQSCHRSPRSSKAICIQSSKYLKQ
jgi:hypothetical protein